MGKQQKLLRRTLAACLCFALLPASGCGKKKEKRADEVRADDPYFDAEIYELKIPTDETKEISKLFFDSISYSGKQIRIIYDLSYVPPKNYDIFTEGREYNRKGTAVFDLKGNMISNENTSLRDSEAAEKTSYDKDGNLVELYMEGSIAGNTYQILIKNDEGQEIRKVELKIPKDLKETYFWSIKCLPDGKYILSGPDSIGETALHVFGDSGDYLFSATSQERSIRTNVLLCEGKPYVLTASKKPNAPMEINEIDMTNGTIKEGKEISSTVEWTTLEEGEDGLYFTTGSGISRLDVTSGETEEILNWNHTDVNREMLTMANSYPVNKDEVNVLVASSYSVSGIDSCYFIHLTRASSNPHAGKKILRMAGIYISPEIYGAIHEFNSDRSHTARIETVDYIDMYDVSDSASGLSVTDRIYLDMMEGNSPDILLSFGGMGKFARSDLLLDLNPYIDGELGLDRSEYFDNIFRANEINGKLFAAPLSFKMHGYLADMNRLDIQKNWTLDDLEKTSEKLSSDVQLMPQRECSELLYEFLGYDFSSYVDPKTKDVKFSCDQMKRIMDAAKKYGRVNAKPEYLPSQRAVLAQAGYYGVFARVVKSDEPGPFEEDIYRDRKYALISADLGNISEYAFLNSLSGGAYKLVGSPTAEGAGVCAYAQYSMAIVKNTRYPKEAWEIIRGFFTEKTQKSLLGDINVDSTSFPIKKSVFLEENADAVSRINRAYENWKEDSLDSSTGLSDYFFFPASEGLEKELSEIAEEIQCVISLDEDIADVIEEETDGYFAGSRSADDVLQNIDRRVRQIVQER